MRVSGLAGAAVTRSPMPLPCHFARIACSGGRGWRPPSRVRGGRRCRRPSRQVTALGVSLISPERGEGSPRVTSRPAPRQLSPVCAARSVQDCVTEVALVGPISAVRPAARPPALAAAQGAAASGRRNSEGMTGPWAWSSCTDLGNTCRARTNGEDLHWPPGERRSLRASTRARKGTENDRRSNGDGLQCWRARRPHLSRRLGATMTQSGGLAMPDLPVDALGAGGDYDAADHELVERERAELREFVAGLSPDEIRSGA